MTDRTDDEERVPSSKYGQRRKGRLGKSDVATCVVYGLHSSKQVQYSLTVNPSPQVRF